MLELRTLQLQIDGLRAGGFQLRLGLRDVGACDDSGGILVLRQRVRALIGVDGLIEQLVLGVERSQLKVVGRKFSR